MRVGIERSTLWGAKEDGGVSSWDGYVFSHVVVCVFFACHTGRDSSFARAAPPRPPVPLVQRRHPPPQRIDAGGDAADQVVEARRE